MLCSEFARLIYAVQMGLLSRWIKLVIFICLPASIAAALRRPCKLLRCFAAKRGKRTFFMLCSEFACWRLWHANAHSFAKNIICYFRLLVREYCWRSHRLREKQNTSFSLARPRKLQRRFAAELDFLCFALSLHG